jgi:Type I phosphodiesterase / nucleotide pyrophosphatase
MRLAHPLPTVATSFVALTLAACTPAASGPRPPFAPPPAGARGPVVVTIVVDQLAAWVVDERLGELPSSGGFARLVREGTRVRELRYAHAATDTAPGHAALYSGETPRESGIYGNEWIDEPTGKRVSVLTDPRVQLVTNGGAVPDARTSSAAKVDAQNLAVLLRAAKRNAYIVSVSLKDRGAIFGGGTAPDASVWYDAGRGEWVTSTAFARQLPPWARAHPSPIATLPDAWTLADPAWVKAHALTPDDQPGEGDLGGMGTTFPHALKTARDRGLAFRATPMANDALVDLALASLEDPAAKERTTLLAVSLSANDYVGHTFGPDSWEAWDELYRLDATLARLFAALDTRFGPGGWSVLLSADHGVVRMPEAYRGCAAGMSQDHWQRPCDGGVRILPDPLAVELDAEAVKIAGPGHWVSGVADPYVYFTTSAMRLDEPKRRALDDALAQTLRARPGIRSVYVTRDVAAQKCAPDADESETALVCRSVAGGPDGGGELYMVAHPGAFFDPSVVVGKGTSHGSPYLFDRAVPLFVRAPGKVPAGVLVQEPLGYGAFAKTAASLLGIAPSVATRGARDLTQPR